MATHVFAKAAGGQRDVRFSRIDNTIHLAHLCKSFVKAGEILPSEELAVLDNAIKIDQNNAEIVGENDGAAQKRGGGIATDAEGVCCKDAVPRGRRYLEREQDALARTETVHLLDADEVVVAGDEGKVAGGDGVGAGAAAQLCDDICDVLLCIAAVCLEDKVEARDVNAGLVANAAEKRVAGRGLGHKAVAAEAVAAREANNIWKEGACRNLLDEGHNPLRILDRDLVTDEVLPEENSDVRGSVEVAERGVLWAMHMVLLNTSHMQQICNPLRELMQVGERRVGALLRLRSRGTADGAHKARAHAQRGAAAAQRKRDRRDGKRGRHGELFAQCRGGRLQSDKHDTRIKNSSSEERRRRQREAGRNLIPKT